MITLWSSSPLAMVVICDLRMPSVAAALWMFPLAMLSALRPTGHVSVVYSGHVLYRTMLVVRCHQCRDLLPTTWASRMLTAEGLCRLWMLSTAGAYAYASCFEQHCSVYSRRHRSHAVRAIRRWIRVGLVKKHKAGISLSPLKCHKGEQD